MGASESKLAFKEDIFRLAGEPDIPADSQWWKRFYQLPESAEDVFALWSTNDLHSLTQISTNHTNHDRDPQQHPSTDTSSISPKKNVETLIYTCIARLEALQTRHCFADPHTPIATEVLNCMRILTRLLPYIYDKDELREWEERFFWQPRKATTAWDHKTNTQGPSYDGLDPKKQIDAEKADEVLGEPLGEKLLELLVGYLFFPGFTLPKKLDAQGQPSLEVTYQIWQSGIGCRQSQGMTKENERNAMETLRLLITLSSRAMYTSPGMIAATNIKPLTYLTMQLSRQATLSIICSLMNTVLKYNPASWRIQTPVDWAGATKDPKQQFIVNALQLLLVFIVYTPPKDETNQLRKALGRLHRAEDFQFIFAGISLVLTQPVSGVASYLPTASKALPWAPETLQLFWELLQCNKRFRAFLIDTDRAHDACVLVLYYAMEARDDPARQGIVRMCVFILQTLSVESSFGDKLNKGFVGQESLPALLKIQNFHGSYADFLITTIHIMITSTRGRLEPMYPALLAVLNNIAPHVKDLQRATSSKLMDLFVSFSAPSFLLANETNHNLLLSLLEAMSAVLEHQYEANRRFVDIVVRGHRRIAALRNFTVEGALDELDRAARQRKDAGEASVNTVAPLNREASAESVRSPTMASLRSPSLGNVPEDGHFVVGDDEDDEHEPADSRGRISDSFTEGSGSRGSGVGVDDAVPLQSRSMSEKARGKQPVGQGTFSRSTSRNTSTTSLASLTHNASNATGSSSLITTSLNTGFQPTAEWLSSWIPFLPLHTLITTIEFENGRSTKKLLPQAHNAAGASGTAQQPHPDNTIQPDQPSGAGSAAGWSAERNGAAGDGGARGQRTRPDFHDTTVKIQTFSWSPLSLGWYTSMLWSWIYAADVAANAQQGIWVGTQIRLFNVVTAKENRITLRNPRGAVDAAGNAIAQRLSSFSLKQTTREV